MLLRHAAAASSASVKPEGLDIDPLVYRDTPRITKSQLTLVLTATVLLYRCLLYGYGPGASGVSPA